jgi:hypothetical protein
MCRRWQVEGTCTRRTTWALVCSSYCLAWQPPSESRWVSSNPGWFTSGCCATSRSKGYPAYESEDFTAHGAKYGGPC